MDSAVGFHDYTISSALERFVAVLDSALRAWDDTGLTTIVRKGTSQRQREPPALVRVQVALKHRLRWRSEPYLLSLHLPAYVTTEALLLTPTSLSTPVSAQTASRQRPALTSPPQAITHTTPQHATLAAATTGAFQCTPSDTTAGTGASTGTEQGRSDAARAQSDTHAHGFQAGPGLSKGRGAGPDTRPADSTGRFTSLRDDNTGTGDAGESTDHDVVTNLITVGDSRSGLDGWEVGVTLDTQQAMEQSIDAIMAETDTQTDTPTDTPVPTHDVTPTHEEAGDADASDGAPGTAGLRSSRDGSTTHNQQGTAGGEPGAHMHGGDGHDSMATQGVGETNRARVVDREQSGTGSTRTRVAEPGTAVTAAAAQQQRSQSLPPAPSLPPAAAAAAAASALPWWPWRVSYRPWWRYAHQHKLQHWFACDHFLLLQPHSFSRRFLDEGEALSVLSAAVCALSARGLAWPLFVPVHDALRDAYHGVVLVPPCPGHPGGTSVRLIADCVHTSDISSPLVTLRGQIEVFERQLRACAPRTARACRIILTREPQHTQHAPQHTQHAPQHAEASQLSLTARYTWRLPWPLPPLATPTHARRLQSQGSMQAPRALYTWSSNRHRHHPTNPTADPTDSDTELSADMDRLNGDRWDEGSAWAPWAAHTDPIQCVELDVVWVNVRIAGGASPADPGDSAVYLDDPPHPTDTHPQHTHNHDHKAAHQAEASDGDTQPPTPVSSSHHQQHPHKLPPLTFNRSSGWSRLPGPELQPMQAQVWTLHALHQGLSDVSSALLGLWANERERGHVRLSDAAAGASGGGAAAAGAGAPNTPTAATADTQDSDTRTFHAMLVQLASMRSELGGVCATLGEVAGDSWWWDRPTRPLHPTHTHLAPHTTSLPPVPSEAALAAILVDIWEGEPITLSMEPSHTSIAHQMHTTHNAAPGSSTGLDSGTATAQAEQRTGTGQTTQASEDSTQQGVSTQSDTRAAMGVSSNVTQCGLSEGSQWAYEHTAPMDSPLTRLALHSLVCGNPRAVAVLWTRFLRSLRLDYWDTLTPLPLPPPRTHTSHSGADEPQAVDTSTCLLYQKLQVLNVCIKRLVGRRFTLLTPTHPTAPTPNTHTTSLNSQGSSSQSVESGTEQGPSNGDGFYSASDDEDVLYDTHTQTRVQSLIRADHDNTDGGVIMTHVDSGAWASQDADDGGVSGSRAESDGLGSSRVGSGGQAGLGDGVSGLPVEIDGPVSARRAGRVSKRGTVPVPQGAICEVGEGVTLARHPDRPMRTPVTQARPVFSADRRRERAAQLRTVQKWEAHTLEAYTAAANPTTTTPHSTHSQHHNQPATTQPSLETSPSMQTQTSPEHTTDADAQQPEADTQQNQHSPQHMRDAQQTDADAQQTMHRDAEGDQKNVRGARKSEGSGHRKSERDGGQKSEGAGSESDMSDVCALSWEVLASDMAAFKAANPGAVMQDFTRWRALTGPDAAQPMSSHTAARFAYTWDTAAPCPAAQQKPLQDPRVEGERVLHELETWDTCDTLDTLLALGLAAALALLGASQGGAVDTVTRLCQRFHRMSSGVVSASGALLDPSHTQSHSHTRPSGGGGMRPHTGPSHTRLLCGFQDPTLELVLDDLEYLERVVVLAESLCIRIPGCESVVNDMIAAAIDGRPTRVYRTPQPPHTSPSKGAVPNTAAAAAAAAPSESWLREQLCSADVPSAAGRAGLSRLLRAARDAEDAEGALVALFPDSPSFAGGASTGSLYTQTDFTSANPSYTDPSYTVGPSHTAGPSHTGPAHTAGPSRDQPSGHTVISPSPQPSVGAQWEAAWGESGDLSSSREASSHLTHQQAPQQLSAADSQLIAQPTQQQASHQSTVADSGHAAPSSTHPPLQEGDVLARDLSAGSACVGGVGPSGDAVGGGVVVGGGSRQVWPEPCHYEWAITAAPSTSRSVASSEGDKGRSVLPASRMFVQHAAGMTRLAMTLVSE